MSKDVLKPVGLMVLGVVTLIINQPTRTGRGQYAEPGVVTAAGWLFIALGLYLLLFTLWKRRSR